MKTEADHNDAQIILKLYELRREAVMREARNFMLGAFDTRTFEPVHLVATSFGSPENAWYRQVTSYWEMAASFVNRGVLSAALFADNCGEGLYIYAKLEAHIPKLRELGSPAFLKQIEKAMADHPVIRERFQVIQAVVKKRMGQ